MKVLVSLDDALLRRVDEVARRRGLTRSAYLAALAERDVAAALGPGADERARVALSRLAAVLGDAEGEDVTDAVRRERDAR